MNSERVIAVGGRTFGLTICDMSKIGTGVKLRWQGMTLKELYPISREKAHHMLLHMREFTERIEQKLQGRSIELSDLFEEVRNEISSI